MATKKKAAAKAPAKKAPAKKAAAPKAAKPERKALGAGKPLEAGKVHTTKSGQKYLQRRVI